MSESVNLRRLPLWLALAMLVHNAEEFLALGAMPEALAQASTLLGFTFQTPPLANVRIGLILFALIPAAILCLAAFRPSPRLAFITCMIAAMTVTNALVPHIALALATGGYGPGLVSAVLLTLPVGLFTLHTARRQSWLSSARWLAAIATGVALLPLVLAGFWALGQLIAELSF